jgi:hypothetical protein
MPIYITSPTGSTSGTSTFPATRDLIVKRALRIVGAYNSIDLPRPEQMTDAISVLNIMLKAWSREAFLWLRQFTTVTLVAGQNVYVLGPAGTPVMDRPQHVYAVNKRATGGSEIPMVSLTRGDWMAIPNKTSTGVPVQYYYDPQTINGNLYVWPTPAIATTDILVVDHDIQLDMMNDNLNDFDFPPNWLETITYCLAARLAPEYGLSLAERSQLEKESIALFTMMSSDERDIASIKFEVRQP